MAFVPSPMGNSPDDWYPWAESLVTWLRKRLGFGEDGNGSAVGGVSGDLQLYGGSVMKDGWAKANGQVLKQKAYPALFRIWGTTFNTGGEASDEFRAPAAYSPGPHIDLIFKF